MAIAKRERRGVKPKIDQLVLIDIKQETAVSPLEKGRVRPAEQ
jgi:hypothetical protein